MFSVSLDFVHRVVSLHKHYGQVTDPCAQPQGGHRILTSEDDNYIRSLIEERPTIYLDEIQEKLVTEHGVNISLATISRTLASANSDGPDLAIYSHEWPGMGPSASVNVRITCFRDYPALSGDKHR